MFRYTVSFEIFLYQTRLNSYGGKVLVVKTYKGPWWSEVNPELTFLSLSQGVLKNIVRVFRKLKVEFQIFLQYTNPDFDFPWKVSILWFPISYSNQLDFSNFPRIPKIPMFHIIMKVSSLINMKIKTLFKAKNSLQS